MPADDQEMVFPCASVMVIIVLLNDAFTCATPEVMFLRSRFLTRAGSLAIGRSALLLLARYGLGGALAGAGVGVGALAADGQPLAVAQTPVAGEVHQALDVDGGLAAQIPFDGVVAIDRLADLQHFLVGQLVDPARVIDADLAYDLVRLGLADAVDVLQRDHDALVGRDVDAGDTGHARALLETMHGKRERRLRTRPHSGGRPLSVFRACRGRSPL